MKCYNYFASMLGMIFLSIILLSCSNDEVVTSTDYMNTPIQTVLWEEGGGSNNNGGTTSPCRLTATSTACPGTEIGGGTNTGGELVITGSKRCSWLSAGHRHSIYIQEDSLNDPNKTVYVRGNNEFGDLISAE